MRSERFRYIRYADGSEELYDLQADPEEWKNLANEPRHAETKRELARWLPQKDVPPVPGSRHRILVRDGDQWLWEGKPIRAADKVE